MKNKMPLDGLGLGHDSGSVHCDMLKMLCFRTAWGGYFDSTHLPLLPSGHSLPTPQFLSFELRGGRWRQVRRKGVNL